MHRLSLIHILLIGPNVHPGYVRQIINLPQTTSGSYLLMSSLDISRRNLAPVSYTHLDVYKRQNSIYATAPNQLYGTNDYYLIQGASEYLKGNIQLSQIEAHGNVS